MVKLNRSLLYFLLVGGILASILVGIFLKSVCKEYVLINVFLHSGMEGFGTVIAFVVVMLLMEKSYRNYGNKRYLLAAGFLGMGLFDGVHLLFPLGEFSFLLQSVANLVGGFSFSLLCLANQSFFNRFIDSTRTFLLGVGVLYAGLLWFLLRNGLPAVPLHEEANGIVRSINILASGLFLLGSGKLLIEFHRFKSINSYLFSSTAIFFALSGFMFGQSTSWCLSWWWWHFMRIAAYLIVLGFVVYEHRCVLFELENNLSQRERIAEELRDHRSHLEAMVKERTGELIKANEQLKEEITQRERVEGALRQSERELGIRNKIADIFFAVRDERMYAQVLQVVLDVLGSKAGLFGYVDSEGFLGVPAISQEVLDSCKLLNKDLTLPIKLSREYYQAAVREQKIVFRSGLFNLPEGHIRIVRDMLAPIIHNGNVIGVIQVANKATEYDKNDEELLQTLIGYLAPILNARLQKEKEMERRRLIEEALRVSEERYRCLVENVNMGISLIDTEYNTIMANAAQGRLLNKPVNELVGKKCFHVIHGRDSICPDCPGKLAIESCSSHEIEVQANSAHFLSSPILLRAFPVFDPQGKVSGFIKIVEDISERKKAEKELVKHRYRLGELVRERTAKLTMANDALNKEVNERKRAEEKLTLYSEEIRSLASELSLVEEQERRRIAVGLHDDIGQSLFMIKMKLQVLQKSLYLDAFNVPISEVLENITQTIQHTRTLTFELSSPILYELGLEPALEWLVEQVYERHGISSVFSTDKQTKPLNVGVSILLYQSVRELLANVVKHAQSKKVEVHVYRENGNVRIDVSDDGVGFDVIEIKSCVSKKGAFGLFSIRERLNYLGGELEIKSKEGKGTLISLVTPLKSK